MNKKQGPNRLVRLVPVLCNILGTIILLTVVLSCLPIAVPKFMGYNVFAVVSGSMEPEISVGSAVYVESVAPWKVTAGDVIAFYSGDSVVVHRVVSNDQTLQEFVTKGDANAMEDINAVSYDRLIGHVVRSLPGIGQMMFLYTSTFGKLCVICFAALGVVLNVMAGQLRTMQKTHDFEAERRNAK